MDFETFKENLAKDVKEKLDARFGGDTTVESQKVDKANETYEALTVKPENSNIGVNLNADKLYESYQDGAAYDNLVDRAAEMAGNALDALKEHRYFEWRATEAQLRGGGYIFIRVERKNFYMVGVK